jgi:hypothetical protein
MFILYVVVISIIISYFLGGRLKFMLQRPLKHVWLATSGLLIQIIIFSNFFTSRYDDAVSVILHGISYLLIISFVFINRKIPGILLIGIGIILNATVIFLNGGYMPASLESVEKTSIGRQFEILSQGSTTNNSQAITEDTVLPWLADIFYIPSWMPFSNVFSIGDVLIAIGVCIYIIRCMKPVDKDMEAVDAK